MSGTSDPMRLRGMVARGSLLERGLEAAQASGPTDEQLQALERRVLAGLGATAATAAALTMAKTAGTQGAGAAAGWLSAGSSKLLVALVATVAIGGGSVTVWRLAKRSAPPARNSTLTPATQKVVQAPLALSELAPPAELSPAPMVASPAAGRSRISRPAQEQALAPSPATTTFRKAEARAVSRGSVRETSDEELSLLARANRALASSPALALSLADEHMRRFPASGMDQERELIAITALVNLGRMGEAQRRAAAFTSAHPDSIYQRRIDNALAVRR